MPDVKINLDELSYNQTLDGNLAIPANPKGIIIFAHGSGSGKDSPRNQYVAKMLNDYGFSTLLVDLLTPQEQELDIKSQGLIGKYPGIVLNKFNIFLLSNRLTTITKWLIAHIPEVKDLPIGYFGSSTGAAAAIESSVSLSSEFHNRIYAIVSRGGRPDLAATESLKLVKASTLLIIGSKDAKEVIDLNKKALKQLKNSTVKELVTIPNAGHLFEEEGTIEQVADISVKWCNKFLMNSL